MSAPKLAGKSQRVKPSVTLKNFGTNEYKSTDFRIIEKLGEGSYGSVFLAKHPRQGFIALKELPIATNDVNMIRKEVEFMREISSENLVGYLGSFVDKENYYIAMEYCEYGSISDVFKALKIGLEDNEIAYVARCCLKGLQHLHSLKKMHRDIKAANLLVSSKGVVKIADFGVSTDLSAQSQRCTFIGTPYWMAPEVIEAKIFSGYSYQADIWSLGITCIEMADMIPPFGNIHPMKALFVIAKKTPRTVAEPEKHSKTFNDFVARCLTFEPLLRPSAEELLKDPFVKNSENSNVILPKAKMTLQIIKELGREKVLRWDDNSNEEEKAKEEESKVPNEKRITKEQQEALNKIDIEIESLRKQLEALQEKKLEQNREIEINISQCEKELKALKDDLQKKPSQKQESVPTSVAFKKEINDFTVHVLDPETLEKDKKLAKERAHRLSVSVNQPQKEMLNYMAEYEVAKRLYLSSLLLLVKMEDRDAGEEYPKEHYEKLEKSCTSVDVDFLPIELLKLHNSMKNKYNMRRGVKVEEKSEKNDCIIC